VAWLRWGLGIVLNRNVFSFGICCKPAWWFFNGLCISIFIATPANNELRLFVMTGALGALTTFSYFSQRSIRLFAQQQYMLASTHLLTACVSGSLLMTALDLVVHA